MGPGVPGTVLMAGLGGSPTPSSSLVSTGSCPPCQECKTMAICNMAGPLATVESDYKGFVSSGDLYL